MDRNRWSHAALRVKPSEATHLSSRAHFFRSTFLQEPIARCSRMHDVRRKIPLSSIGSVVTERVDVREDGGTASAASTLTNADLREANLEDANLARAQLQGADLQEASLRRADLSQARLDSADLRKARLEGANLSGADLQGANFTCAVFARVDLGKSNVTSAQLCEAATLEGFRADSSVVRATENQCPARILKPEDDPTLTERCPEFEIDETGKLKRKPSF